MYEAEPQVKGMRRILAEQKGNAAGAACIAACRGKRVQTSPSLGAAGREWGSRVQKPREDR